MKFLKKLFIPIFVVFSFQSFAQKVEEIAKGTPLRKQLLDLSRPNAEKEFGQKIEFKVSSMRKMGDLVFVMTNVQQKGGKELDRKKVKMEEPFDDNYYAIYKLVNGKWAIFRELMGCTDVCWLEWKEDKAAKIPEKLLIGDKK